MHMTTTTSQWKSFMHRFITDAFCLQCFDAVGWAAGRASGLMPLPFDVSCFSKIQIGFTFLVLAHTGNPGQRVVKRVSVYVCVCVLLRKHQNLWEISSPCCRRKLSTVLRTSWKSCECLWTLVYFPDDRAHPTTGSVARTRHCGVGC